MQYYSVLFDSGESLLQEVYQGIILRYCDASGNTVTPPPGGSRSLGLITPGFTPPPDPVATPDPVVTPDAPPDAVAPVAPSYTDILGAPLRVLAYDDKGQIVRIDYPQSGVYQMLEYADGRLRKITEISPIGVCYERHYYYDNWGRFQEETQL